MTKKRSFLVAISSVCTLLVVAVVAVVAVIAAQNAQVTSEIGATYTANHVAATVSAKYSVAGATKVDMTVNGQASGAKTVTFNGSEATATGALTPQVEDIALDGTNNYIVFEYVFTNNSDDHGMTVALDTTNLTSDNLAIKYKSSASEISSDYATTITDASLGTVTVAHNATVYVYVMTSIANFANDATLGGSFGWTLTAVAAE